MPTTLDLISLVPALSQKASLLRCLAETTFIGVDFGTSTTVASVATAGDGSAPVRAEPIPIRQVLSDGRVEESHLVPSVVAWFEDQLLVGTGAQELRQRLVPGRDVWSSFKMELGVDLGPQFFNSELGPGHPVATIQTPKDAASVFFRYLKQGVDRFVETKKLPPKLQWSVSIPASFESNQRRDLIEALDIAGIVLPTQVLIDEPNAAFLSYLAEASQNTLGSFRLDRSTPLHVLVFDFGAGTCDISILEIGPGPERYRSRNLAISRFQALGGDDIDRLIVHQVLLPQMLDQSGSRLDELTTADLKKRIIPQLMPTAEALKIAVCKQVSLQMVGQHLPPLASSRESLTLQGAIRIATPKRDLTLQNAALSFEAFSRVMGQFTANSMDGRTGESSVLGPVQSAMAKASLSKDDLDLVLLIGGSAANPYVQAALRDFLPSVELEVPQDLRSHVSTGAALNALLVQGLGVSLIQPITSEPIVIVTQNGGLRTLLPAGTPIPCETVSCSDFSVSRPGQLSIEIPVCVSSERKLLSLIEVESPDEEGFDLDTAVTISCEFTEDKVLMVSATVGERLAVSVVANPFANRELTTEERSVLEAERSANMSAARSGGVPSSDSLERLASALKRARDYLRAAEVTESWARIHKHSGRETELCYLYAKAGRFGQAAAWAKSAYAANRTAVTAFNLAICLQHDGETDRFEELMQEALTLDGDAAFVLATFGRYLSKSGRPAGRKMLKRAITLLRAELQESGLDEDDAGRLAMAGECVGDASAVEDARSALAKLDRDKFFHHESLLAAGPVGVIADEE